MLENRVGWKIFPEIGKGLITFYGELCVVWCFWKKYFPDFSALTNNDLVKRYDTFPDLSKFPNQKI